MSDYWRSDKMSFQSGNQRLYGWGTLLQRDKTNYAGEKMGRLTFSDIEVVVLSDNFAYALGRWKIIHDHSS